MKSNKLNNKTNFIINRIRYAFVGSTNKLKFSKGLKTYNFKIRFVKRKSI